MTITPAAFMAAAPQTAVGGNTPAAARYAAEVRAIAREYAARRPRSLQVHLGPSEIGVECDRQVVSKLLQHPETNHVVDPWPSLAGTWLHAGAADMFDWYNRHHSIARFVTEHRVVPHDDHAGTGDLYDGAEQAVDDHKFLGETSMAKVRSAAGPPRKYVVQLHTYALGFRRLGLPVKVVRLLAWPRTGSSLDGLYCWEQPHDSAAEQLVADVFDDMNRRKLMAGLVESGHLRLDQVPVAPSDDECYFCPFYRPESARDGGPGCPGNRAK